MKAAIRNETGLVIADIEIPRPKATEILVKVRASSLNRADLSLVDGKSHGSVGGPGTVLGLEWSGDVVEVGEAVTAYKAGDKVMCSGIGGFAEYAVTDWRRAFPFPAADMDYETAACLCVALRTTHTAMRQTAQLEAGQSVMVLGASSGVGLMSLQVARHFGASLVIGTSTKADRRDRLAGFGADVALDSNDPGWVKKVLELTDGRGVDLLVDFLAGPLINDSMRAVAIGGRIVNIGRMAGESGTFDFDLHSMRRIQYLGMTFRTRSVEDVGAIAERVRKDFWPALARGELRLPIDVRLPLDRVAQACEMMRENTHFGKIVLTQDS
ncbi:zinc-binding alcohol dehydrogenase family protein [Cupriavidus sp. 2TAF22]|uniref:quinone oxidoreductase family protein n=1 Tax=unclassified Cupriavidus TaxID=2640874 RepID=UPI003F8FB53F